MLVFYLPHQLHDDTDRLVLLALRLLELKTVK